MKLAKIEDLFNVSSRFIKNINFILEGSIPSLLNNPKTKIFEDISNILQLDYFIEIKNYCELGIKRKEKMIKILESTIAWYVITSAVDMIMIFFDINL